MIGNGLFQELIRRGQHHPQTVFSGMQRPLHVKAPTAVHVIRLADLLPIDIDGRQRVQPLKEHLHMLTGKERGVHLKGTLIRVIPVEQRRSDQFILPHEGIGNQVIVQQVVEHGAGHLRGNLLNAAGLLQRPRTVQR